MVAGIIILLYCVIFFMYCLFCCNAMLRCGDFHFSVSGRVSFQPGYREPGSLCGGGVLCSTESGNFAHPNEHFPTPFSDVLPLHVVF